LAPPSNEDVSGFDVAMDDSFAVRGIERLRNGHRKSKKFVHIERLSSDALFQRLALQQLHREEILSVNLANFMNRANIWVIQCGGRAGLAPKALYGLMVAGERIGKELKRN
jgi:hypothetical protein